MNDSKQPPSVAVGLRAKFFHPKTLGVMHWGTVVKVLSDGRVRVRFDVDNKVHTTTADHNL